VEGGDGVGISRVEVVEVDKFRELVEKLGRNGLWVFKGE